MSDLIIPLIRGITAIVDQADGSLVLPFKWTLSAGYASASIGGKPTYLHRFLLQAKPGEMVDHRDLDRLNNRRSNLRLCTRADNNRNCGKKKSVSAYKGVAWAKWASRWRAMISVDYRFIHLGYFHSDIEAARAYDAAALRYHGEFANTNFPREAP